MAIETVHGGLAAVNQVVGEIEQVRAKHESAIADLRDKPIIIPVENGVVVPEAIAKARIAAIKASREASILEREEALRREVVDLRDQGREKLEAAKAALATEYYRAVMATGPSGAEWTEAESRSQFVKEDLERQSNPADVVELYQTALAAGDKTGSWLIARYGSERLAALAKSTDVGEAGRAQLALAELERLAWAGAVAARRDAERKLAELGRRLNEPQTRDEKLEFAANFADRFGMSQSAAELVDSGTIDAAMRFGRVAYTAPVPA